MPPDSVFTARLFRRLAGVLFLTMLTATCRSAAAVFLDVPEPAPESARVDSEPEPVASSAQPPGFAAGVYAADTIRPVIEEVGSADSILAILPRHSSGGVDWVKAVEEQIVKPRDALPDSPPLDRQQSGYDFYYGEVDTYFPHSGHTDWLSCANCHPTVFRGPGSRATSMKELSEGKSCGVCHGKMAFALEVCERCHPALGLPEDRIEPELVVDVVIPRDSTVGMTNEFAPSLFPHWIHRIRYRCSTCHDALFAAEVGSNGITMKQIQEGESCGTCHDDATAFGALQCARCHAPVPEPVRLAEPDPAVPDPADTG